MNEEYLFILVDSTSHAMRIEKLLREASLPCKLIPVPRQLSSDCGVCVRIPAPEGMAAQNILTLHQAAYRSIAAI